MLQYALVNYGWENLVTSAAPTRVGTSEFQTWSKTSRDWFQWRWSGIQDEACTRHPSMMRMIMHVVVIIRVSIKWVTTQETGLFHLCVYLWGHSVTQFIFDDILTPVLTFDITQIRPCISNMGWNCDAPSYYLNPIKSHSFQCYIDWYLTECNQCTSW